MIKLSDYCTEKAFPTEMRTAERIALAYAYDNQKKKILEHIKKVYIWADLENVDDDKLDFLAVENRVLFYDTRLAPDVKRNLIRNYLYWYIKLGTRQAMDEMASILYPAEENKIEEWHEYAGEPYHFRVYTTLPIMEDCYADFRLFIQKVKNARSRLDQIYTLRRSCGVFHAATATSRRFRNPAVNEGYELLRSTVLKVSASVISTKITRDPSIYEGYEIKKHVDIAVGGTGHLVSVSMTPPSIGDFERMCNQNINMKGEGVCHESLTGLS